MEVCYKVSVEVSWFGLNVLNQKKHLTVYTFCYPACPWGDVKVKNRVKFLVCCIETTLKAFKDLSEHQSLNKRQRVGWRNRSVELRLVSLLSWWSCAPFVTMRRSSDISVDQYPMRLWPSRDGGSIPEAFPVVHICIFIVCRLEVDYGAAPFLMVSASFGNIWLLDVLLYQTDYFCWFSQNLQGRIFPERSRSEF